MLTSWRLSVARMRIGNVPVGWFDGTVPDSTRVAALNDIQVGNGSSTVSHTSCGGSSPTLSCTRLSQNAESVIESPSASVNRSAGSV